jgi:eukaryotic-like serine/threonine-protein kinase
VAKDREQRFATARDFASALQSAMRRAEDATVVPPADPFKKADAGGTASKVGQQSMTGGGNSVTSGSTVTQELELVYWKDIKDSTDPEEFDGFLGKFPAGIYADLARRRLRKLSGASSPDQTILSGGTTMPAEPDMDATRLRTGTTPLVVTAPAAASAPAEEPQAVPPAVAAVAPEEPVVAAAPAATADDFTTTIIEPRDVSKPEVAIVAAKPVEEGATPTAPAVAPSMRRKQPVAMLAGVGAVVVAGIAAFFLMARGAPENGAAAGASVASSSAPAVPVGAAVVLASATAPVAAVSAGAALAAASSAPAAKASAPRRPASAAKAKPVASALPVEISRSAAAVPAPVREETRAASSTAGMAANPVEACKDKVFLSKEFCLAENCDKAGARNHPLCVTRREEAKTREDSKVRN